MPKKDRAATRTTPGFTGPFKGNPQQGTLFDVRTVPKDPTAIGPRGYSLERSRQFQQVLPKIRHHPQVGVAETPFARTGGQRAPEGPGASGYLEQGRVLQRGRSKMIDALARSTVRPEAMRGLSHIDIEPSNPSYAGVYRDGSTIDNRNIGLAVTRGSQEAGQTYETSYPERVKHPEQRGPIDPDSEITLMHEIGHHVSRMAGNESALHYGTTNAMRATEEARADRHAMETWRQDPREYRWDHAKDPREHTYGGMGVIPGQGGPPEEMYYRTLGEHNRAPARRDYGPEAMTTEAIRERHLRPMLDEHHFNTKEYPLDEHDESIPNESPFTPTNVPGWADRHESEPARRTAVYKKAVQRRNIRSGVFRNEQANNKARWGVTNRRQFGEQ